MHISFSEILVILLVALLVIKPERMPAVATRLGRLVKTIRGLTTKLYTEIDQPMGKYSYKKQEIDE